MNLRPESEQKIAFRQNQNDFLGLSLWKLKFQFKTTLRRAQHVVYQCFSVESTLM